MFFHANGIGTENNRSSRFLSLLPRDRTRTRDCRVRPETQWARGFLAKQPGVSAQAGNMQKKIIALAVAGLVSGIAYAQTNVTVYGIVDQGYGYISGKNAAGNLKRNAIDDGGNLGLDGGFVIGVAVDPFEEAEQPENDFLHQQHFVQYPLENCEYEEEYEHTISDGYSYEEQPEH